MQEKFHVIWPQRKGAVAYAHMNGEQAIWKSKSKGATEFTFAEGRRFILRHTNSLLLNLVEV